MYVFFRPKIDLKRECLNVNAQLWQLETKVNAQLWQVKKSKRTIMPD